MINIKFIAKTCRWQDVPIIELDENTVKVYRKKVKTDKLLDFAKSKLMEAVKFTVESQNLELIPKLSDSQTILTVDSIADSLFRDVHCFSLHSEIVWRIEDRIKTAIAVLVYMYGIDFYNELKNK